MATPFALRPVRVDVRCGRKLEDADFDRGDGNERQKQLAMGIATTSLAILGIGAIYAQTHDKYSVKVPGGLAFSEFRGYESWQMIAVSRQGDQSGDSRGDGSFAVILGNPAMIEALEAGIPDNGKPFPDGAKMAKMHYAQKTLAPFPTATVVGHPARHRLHGQR